ncbi:2834_t:CDS:2 [Ambispora gerdemannii]|uniref:Pyruvate dehydrogenase E1 component subunit alpha n=1 Tax=Ambispora gerdemannii TaxID=144530 RepID=A0A9N9FEK1_9GLOM|nr:2834_t:CDS:2 [Ambispora gerdemannii]
MLVNPRLSMLSRSISLLSRSSQLRARLFSSSAPAASETVNYTLPEGSFQTYECDPPSHDIKVNKEETINMYKQMVLMRRLETTADGLYKSKHIRGFCHLCTGQEAVAVGMEAAITPDDHVITAYRCHGFTLVRGQTPHAILAELMGELAFSLTSLCKGGSMHMFSKNFYGGNGIVGAQVPVGAGIAFAQQYLNTKQATYILYGDGAANQGQVFEAYNISKLWNLPAIYVCENNHYGMGTSASRSSADTNYFARGQYIPGLRVNGMDILAVRQACSWAKDWVLSDKGPLVLEMVTYRYGGHSMSDPGTSYRTREEIQHMRSTNDPITGLKQRLLDLDFLTESETKQIDKDARATIDEAVKLAHNDPFPDETELYTYIFVEGSEPPFVRGREKEEVGHVVHKQ